MDLVCSWHRDPVVSWFKPCYLPCAVCMSSFACVGFLHALQLPKVNVNFNSNPQPLAFKSLIKPAVPTQSEFQMKFTLAYLEVLLAEHMHTR